MDAPTARGVVSSTFVNILANGNNHPLIVIVATRMSDKTRATIRIGRTGLVEMLPKMMAGCVQKYRRSFATK